MKKWWPLLIGICFLCCYWLFQTPALERVPAAAPKPKQTKDVKTVLQIMKPRDPASEASATVTLAKQASMSQRRMKKSHVAIVPKSYRPKLLADFQIGDNYSVVEDLKVIAKSKWKPEMGEFVQSSSHLVYFKPSSPNDEALPVALDAVSGIFHPVSHILHVQGATPELRLELAQESLEEYYFNERLKLLSLSSSPSNVLRQYQELTSKGYEVRLEVLKGLPQTK